MAPAADVGAADPILGRTAGGLACACNGSAACRTGSAGRAGWGRDTVQRSASESCRYLWGKYSPGGLAVVGAKVIAVAVAVAGFEAR